MTVQLSFALEPPLQVSAWLSGRVPRSLWEDISGPLGDMPGAPAIYWYDEKANPFPKRKKGQPKGNAWRKLRKEPGFWVMPVYNLISAKRAPVRADEVTIHLINSEPVTVQSRPLLLALWKMVEADWLRFRFIGNGTFANIEFLPFTADVTDTKVLAPEHATDESNASFARRFG